jgi:hypothetical protein
VAALIDALVTNDAFHDRVVRTQDAALERLEARDFGGMVLRFVDRVRRQPRLPHPMTSLDFWEQVKVAEDLEDVRSHRPAAFQALAKRRGDR